MRNRKDRRRPIDSSAFPFEDVSRTTPERRKRRDRRLANLDAEERQLLLSEMPAPGRGKTPRKD